jgi:hypothetical protein
LAATFFGLFGKEKKKATFLERPRFFFFEVTLTHE